jgi:hypothetical protein
MQQYGARGADETDKNNDFGSQDHPQQMLVFLTDGIATVSELLTSKILAQMRSLNTEIRVL